MMATDPYAAEGIELSDLETARKGPKMRLEMRLNVALLMALGLAWGGLTAGEPVAPLRLADGETQHLAEMEDEFARDPGNVTLARQLSTTYLELERPGLAIATLRAADPTLLEHPVVAHRLAQAYEASGRVLDALATSQLALARCQRSIGTAAGPAGTPVPHFACSARQHAVLSFHHQALEHMAAWGVSRPDADPRARQAYDLATRRARVALAY